MMNTENTALQMIAEAARCPDYGPDMVKALMEKLDMNEKGFALLMNVAPSTVRLWTTCCPGCRHRRPRRLDVWRPIFTEIPCAWERNVKRTAAIGTATWK